MDEELGSYDLNRELTAQEQMGRLVVGVDGSAASVAAVRWAASLATSTGWLIDVVMAWQRPIGYGWDSVGTEGIDWQADTSKSLAAALDEAFGSHHPVGMRTYVVEGDPAQRLLAHADGARLLIVGNRGKGGLADLMLGSVSAKCTTHAHCPVLIVHRDDATPSLTPELLARSSV